MDELHRLNSTYDSGDEPGGNLGKFDGIRVVEDSRQARRERAARRTEVPLSVLICLAVISVALTIALGFLGLLLQFNYDACGDPSLGCNYSLGFVGTFAVPVFGVAALLGLVVLMSLPGRRVRRSWWLPFVLALAPLVGFGVCVALTASGTGHPLL
jgi:hypothetical protein